jgi:capsid assembly protease
MTDEALKNLVSVVQNHHMQENLLEKFSGERIKSTQKAHNRGGVGVIPVRDSLFMRANLMTEHCGATSYATLMKDFNTLLEDESVHAILLDIDSPGGEAGGCSELADAIYGARSKKPVVAYISHYGASAAYWIASACDRIYAADSAIVGSIGVQNVAWSGENEGEIRIVASQSPNKNLDPGTPEGEKAIQERVDALAEIFVQKVARNRGVSRETVMENYGQGAVFVGEKARTQGLVDEISTLEGVIAKLGEKPVTLPVITTAYISENHPEIAQHFRDQGTTATIEKLEAEQKRVESIRESAKGLVSDEFCSGLIESGISAHEANAAIIREAQKNPPKAKPQPGASADADLAGLNTPPVEKSGDQKSADAESLKSTMNFLASLKHFNLRGLEK